MMKMFSSFRLDTEISSELTDIKRSSLTFDTSFWTSSKKDSNSQSNKNEHEGRLSVVNEMPE